MLATGFENINSILLLGAHCDDIEIGCGATILKLKERFPQADFHWVVFSSSEVRKVEAEKCAGLFLEGVKKNTVLIRQFKNAYFPDQWALIKQFFNELGGMINPDIIFTHYRHDLHQDHRVISELTWNTFRNHLILEYEIMKFDGDMGAPNGFVAISKQQRDAKIDFIMDSFESQNSKHWFTRDVFESLMRLRGIEANAPEGFAEAFYCRKTCFL
ncbi:MAG: PIG-L family deacetylase [Gammaproteobacteria bacterium]|nr:PIG-L family deacetylase [Gammaproteobacteria bacterium]